MNLSISRLFNIATLLLLLVSSTAYAQWSDPPSDEIVIRGGWLFDGISNTRRQNTGIVIREGKIVEMGGKWKPEYGLERKRKRESSGINSSMMEKSTEDHKTSGVARKGKQGTAASRVINFQIFKLSNYYSRR